MLVNIQDEFIHGKGPNLYVVTIVDRDDSEDSHTTIWLAEDEDDLHYLVWQDYTENIEDEDELNEVTETFNEDWGTYILNTLVGRVP